MGMAASMGAFLLAAGAKGKRLALPNSDIMIHQPSGGAQGQATDMEIHTRHILDMKNDSIRFLLTTQVSRLMLLQRIPIVITS